MPPRRTRRRRISEGPVPIPIPKTFRDHHAALSAFARDNQPARAPVMISVTRIRALADFQLDELCEDVVVLLPLWRRGLGQGIEAGPGEVIGPTLGISTGPGAIDGGISGPPTPGGGPVPGHPVYGLSTTSTSSSPASSAPTSSPPSPVLSQTQPEAPPAMMPISVLMAMDSLGSSVPSFSHSSSFHSPLPVPSPQQPPYQPLPQPSALYHSSHPPNHQSHSLNPSPQTYHPQQPVPPGGAPLHHPQTLHHYPSNPQLSPPPTEADARALAPNLPLWLPHAPRKRNESRVRLARSFMAGFEGMKALVWDVCTELERRWPLRE